MVTTRSKASRAINSHHNHHDHHKEKLNFDSENILMVQN